MSNTAVDQVTMAKTSTGRGWLWLGVGVSLAAVALNVAQLFALRQLTAPWYLPVFGTIGVALLLYAVVQRRSVSRVLVLGFFALLTAFEWYLLLSFAKTPTYAGPAVGEAMPAFQVRDASGQPFTESDLKHPSRDTILILFRGKW